MVELPERDTSKPLRVPISGIYKIKGVGDVLAGRVEQGQVKPNDEVRFMPTHTAANKCEGKVRSVVLHMSRWRQLSVGKNEKHRGKRAGPHNMIVIRYGV